jgi:hypothetical protein
MKIVQEDASPLPAKDQKNGDPKSTKIIANHISVDQLQHGEK